MMQLGFQPEPYNTAQLARTGKPHCCCQFACMQAEFWTATHALLNCTAYDNLQVGYLDGRVAALRWAPDGEALCIVTSRGQMLLMTKARVNQALPLRLPTGSWLLGGCTSWRGVTRCSQVPLLIQARMANLHS